MARSMKSVPEGVLRQLAEEIRFSRQESASGPATADDATLAAYAAGTLDEPERKRVEGQLAGSPELAEIVAAVRDSLAQGDWRDESPDLAPKLRVPLVLGPSAPAQMRKLGRLCRWAVAAAVAAVLILGVITVFGNSLRDLFRVATERLGGDDTSKLDSSITNAAKAAVNQSFGSLKE